MDFDKFGKVNAILKVYEKGYVPSGTYQIQAKLDGANVGIIRTEQGLQLHSRNTYLGELLPESLGTFGGLSGFVEFVRERFSHFYSLLAVGDHVYAEWLIPHTITYPADMYKKLYVFDNQYQLLVSEELGILQTPRLGEIEITDPLHESGTKLVERIMAIATDYAKTLEHKTEGVVLTRYNVEQGYTKDTDRFKIVFPEFKEDMGQKVATVTDGTPVELLMIQDYPIRSYEKIVEKVKDIKNGADIDNSFIGPVVGMAWQDFMQEFLADSVKKHKMPEVRFKILQAEFTKRIRELILSELQLGKLPDWALALKVRENG